MNIKELGNIKTAVWELAEDDKNDVVTRELFKNLYSVLHQLTRYYENKKLDRIELQELIIKINKTLMLYADLNHNKSIS